MKYCHKCGKKLDEDVRFCIACGAKVDEEVKEVKKEEKKQEKKEKKENKKIEKEEKKVEEVKVEEVKPVEVEPVYTPPKKKGKGKVIFVTILIVLLVAAVVTLSILLVLKGNDSNSNSNSSGYSDKKDDDNKKDTPKKDDKESEFVGDWEHYVTYKENGKTQYTAYAELNLKKDGTFYFQRYYTDTPKNKTELKGTYKIKGDDLLYLYYTYEGEEDNTAVFLKNGKLCIETRNCEDYFVKEGNNKITIDDSDDTTTVEFIDYYDYKDIIDDKDDALVVVVREGCVYCEKYESVVEKIADNYSTPIYYYESDGKIDVDGTPTTFIIQEGKIVKKIEGYYEYDKVSAILDSYDVY